MPSKFGILFAQKKAAEDDISSKIILLWLHISVWIYELIEYDFKSCRGQLIVLLCTISDKPFIKIEIGCPPKKRCDSGSGLRVL